MSSLLIQSSHYLSDPYALQCLVTHLELPHQRSFWINQLCWWSEQDLKFENFSPQIFHQSQKDFGLTQWKMEVQKSSSLERLSSQRRPVSQAWSFWLPLTSSQVSHYFQKIYFCCHGTSFLNHQISPLFLVYSETLAAHFLCLTYPSANTDRTCLTLIDCHLSYPRTSPVQISWIQ